MDFNLSKMNSKQLSPLPWNIILDRGRMFILNIKVNFNDIDK